MDPEEQDPHLTLLSEAELSEDPFPDAPFRMAFPGFWTVGADGIRRRSDIAVRLSSADLGALEMQIRAARLSYHARVSRMSLEDIEAERERATAAALEMAAGPPPVELLETVLVRLREAA